MKKYDFEAMMQPSPSPPYGGMAALGGCLLLEFFMWVMFYGVYMDTIGILSDVYLSELAAIGPLFAFIDDEMTVSHLMAAMLAFFSCATPIYIWNIILANGIHKYPQDWLSKPINQIYAALMASLFLLVFAVEVVNLYTLIAQSENTGPLYTGKSSALMSYLAQNKGLGIFVSILLAIINAVIALITAKVAHQLKTAWKETQQ